VLKEKYKINKRGTETQHLPGCHREGHRPPYPWPSGRAAASHSGAARTMRSGVNVIKLFVFVNETKIVRTNEL
jgi:hypothetical protein